MSPCRIGTSVRVAKYISAPDREAKRFAQREFPPTSEAMIDSGIRASWPVRRCRCRAC
jgi:hypothetical protein